MKMVKDYLSLTIRNKMDPSMQDKALTIRTTKADKKQHGLGRQIIDDIVRRYNGISTILWKNLFVKARKDLCDTLLYDLLSRDF